MHQQPYDPTAWTLIGTVPEATSCHKPATVSGGGKSEISKAITDAFIYGSAYVADFDDDMDRVAAILDRDYAQRFLDPARNGQDHRRILSEDRSIGSVIKLLTPSPAEYTAEYNAWLDRIPVHVKELVYVVKRSYRPEWGEDWRSHFSVVIINGRQGNSLRLDGTKITVNMLRVGFNTDGSWRLFGLRHDFSPAIKVQTQDDITASTVVPGSQVGLDPDRSYKLVENCEELLFQRPDDAIHRGLRQAGRARHRLARHVPVQLPAADPGRRHRDARRRGGLQRLQRPDGRDDQPTSPTRPRARDPTTSCARPTRGSWTASRRRTRATCSRDPTAPTPRRPRWPSCPHGWSAGCAPTSR